MGRDTGHLRVVSPGIFYEQLCVQKIVYETYAENRVFLLQAKFCYHLL